MKKVALIVFLTPFLAGCEMTKETIASVCAYLASPEYAVRGHGGYDQRWINRTTESIVVGCRQPRPKARPASLDAPRSVVPTPTPRPKKRIRDRFIGWVS